VVLSAQIIIRYTHGSVPQVPALEPHSTPVIAAQFAFCLLTALSGGTAAGYITFTGAHRLIDSGLSGPEHVKDITTTSVMGIIITGVMRVLLFLAVLGVAATGVALSEDNTAADSFFHAAGEFVLRAFVLFIFVAGLSSIIGASYSSITFATTQRVAPRIRNLLAVVFVIGCTILLVVLNSAPLKLLIFADAFNGIIVPNALALLMWVAFRR